MKIFFISDHYPPYIKGGAEVSTSLLAEWLLKGNSVAAACIQVTDRNWIQNGIPVYPIIPKADLGKKDFKSALAYGIGIITKPIISAIRMINLSKRSKPDVVNIVPSSYQFISIILALRFFLRLPVVVDCRDSSLICPAWYGKAGSDDTKYATHGYRCLKAYSVDNALLKFFVLPFAFYESFVFNFYKWLLRFASDHFSGIEFVAVSEFIRQQMILNGFRSNRVSVIHNIAPVFDFKNEALPDTMLVSFVYAGRIEQEKGIFDLISAVEILQTENLIFNVQIAGTGPDFEALQTYVKEKNLKNVNLLGYITPSEVLDLYSKSSVIVGPSRSPEAFGRFILEAISLGKPLIATRSGGIPEGVEDGVTGMLIDVGNVKQLAAAMRYFIQHPEQCQIMRGAIIEKQKYYTADFIGEQRILLYEKLRQLLDVSHSAE